MRSGLLWTRGCPEERRRGWGPAHYCDSRLCSQVKANRHCPDYAINARLTALISMRTWEQKYGPLSRDDYRQMRQLLGAYIDPLSSTRCVRRASLTSKSSQSRINIYERWCSYTRSRRIPKSGGPSSRPNMFHAASSLEICRKLTTNPEYSIVTQFEFVTSYIKCQS